MENKTEFRAKDIGLRLQKKLASKLSNKNVAKMFIDDVSSELLDNIYSYTVISSKSKKDAEKKVKNIIKIIVKIGILDRNGSFNNQDFDKLEQFKKLFRSLAMTLVSFHEVSYSYERNFLIRQLNKCRDQLKDIVEIHLSNKSCQRVDQIFDFYSQGNVLDNFYDPTNTNVAELRSTVIKHIVTILEAENHQET